VSRSEYRQLRSFGHPPLKGEGRIAEGSPGWGGGGATHAALLMLHRCRPHPDAELVIGPAKGRTRWRPTAPLQGEVKTRSGNLQ
jgi:hypothetical protein